MCPPPLSFKLHYSISRTFPPPPPVLGHRRRHVKVRTNQPHSRLQPLKSKLVLR
jgi:hypothetical protein